MVPSDSRANIHQHRRATFRDAALVLKLADVAYAPVASCWSITAVRASAYVFAVKLTHFPPRFFAGTRTYSMTRSSS